MLGVHTQGLMTAHVQVGAGLQTVLMFKKTVAVGALALAATAVP